MKTSARKGSLDQITHKNRQQILYYISQAKTQIYPHCLICYDSRFFTDLQKSIYPTDIYATCYTSKIQAKSEEAQKQSEGKNKNMSRKIALIPQPQFEKESVPRMKMSQNMTASSTMNQNNWEEEVTKESNQKIIYFNNPDLVFYVEEKKKIIEIHNLANKSMEVRFQLHSQEVLAIVQNLLRRKLCQLGFYDKYKIIKFLGKGGTAQVQLVQRESDKKYFAAKIISTLNTNQKQFQLFINEAKLLRILKHPNIINLQSVYIHKTQLIQVLEYLPGGTLLDILKKNLVKTSQQKWGILRNIIEALEYLRQRRIVHRDLKLENLMVKTSNTYREVVISDFGLASWAGERSPVYEKCGTPGYIAPQILTTPAKTIIIDHRSDIFSLGVIAHILFLHEPLFHFNGNLKDLINDNKKANFNLQAKKYCLLPSQQQNFLIFTLNRCMSNRATSDQLLRLVNTISSKQQKKQVEKPKRKMSLEPEITGVGVEIKRQTSLKKRSIKIDLNCIQKQKISTKDSDQKSPQRKSLILNARKLVSDFWDAISPTATKKNERLKLKENSIQKQRKYSDFLNQ